MADDLTRAMFDGLVRRAGGVDAVAAVMEARFGTGHKGTVSKMCAGQIGVTVAAVEAVEDFVGAYPITQRLFRRLASERQARGCLRELAAESAMAAGVAHAALIRAVSEAGEGGPEVTPAEAAAIAATMRELAETAGRIVVEAERIARGSRGAALSVVVGADA